MKRTEHSNIGNRRDGKSALRVGFPKGRQIDSPSQQEIRSLLSGKSTKREYLIENLHVIQDKYNQLPANLMAALANEMKLSQSEVYEVATFYHHFTVVKENEPARPPLTIRVCNGIACEMAGSKDQPENRGCG